MSTTNQYKVLHPIGLDGRQERGTIIELTPDVAANYPGSLELVSGTEKKEEAPVEVPLDQKNLQQLVEEATKLGLSTEGSKTDLFERISLHLKGDVEAPKGDEAKPADTDANANVDANTQANVEAPKGDEAKV